MSQQQKERDLEFVEDSGPLPPPASHNPAKVGGLLGIAANQMPPSSWVQEVKAQYSRTPEPGCMALHCSHNSSFRAGVQLNEELLSTFQEALGFISAPQERKGEGEREKGWEPGRKRGRKERRERGKEGRKRGRGKGSLLAVFGRPQMGT